MTTPTARTLQYLRERGWRVWITEKFNHHTKQRIDLWNFGDVIAFKGACVLIVQATSQPHLAERQAKIDQNEIAREWRAEANRLVWCMGWRKLKGRGRRQWFACIRELCQDGRWEETQEAA